MAEEFNIKGIWDEAVEAYLETTDRTFRQQKLLEQLKTTEDLQKQLKDYHSQFRSFTTNDDKMLGRISDAARPLTRLCGRASGHHSGNPVSIAAPVLGAMLFMFQAAENITQGYELIAGLLDKVGEYSVRLDEYIKGEIPPPLKKNIVKVFACSLKILGITEKAMKTGKVKRYTTAFLCGEDEGIQKAFNELERLFEEERALVGAIAFVNSQRMGKALQDVKNHGKQTRDSIESTRVGIEAEQLRKSIIQWCSSTDFTSQYAENRDKWQQGTGYWFLEHPKFQQWVDCLDKTLFCYGKPGAGKTVMASMAINYLQNYVQSDTVAVVYAYCSYSNIANQSPNTILSAALRQLLQSRATVPPFISQLYEKCKATGRPPLQDLISMLNAALQDYQRIYLVIDALDECVDKKHTCTRIINITRELQSKTNLHILVTSRPVPEILENYNSDSMLEISAESEDLRVYLDAVSWPTCVRRDKSNNNIDGESLIEEIKTGVVNTVDGMFLLARLYVQWLQGMVRRKEVITALKIISRVSKESSGAEEVYNQAYELTMKRIKSQSTQQTTLAIKALGWISQARRQLTTIELCHALAIEIGDCVLDEDNIPDIEDVVSVCAGLVVVEGQQVRLVHYTTQEYLGKNRSEWAPGLEKEIALACLTHMKYDPFREGAPGVIRDFEARLREYPLLSYVARHWGGHVLAAENENDVIDLAYQFLQHSGLVDSAAHFIAVEKLVLHSRLRSDAQIHNYITNQPRRSTPLHLIAQFGLSSLGKRFIRTNMDKNLDNIGGLSSLVNARDSLGNTPLMLGAYYGHLSVIMLLLDSGADVNIQGGTMGSAFLSAVRGNHEGIIKVLLENNANIHALHNNTNIHALHSSGESALKIATLHGDVSLVGLLLRAGAGEHMGLQAPLNYAAHGGKIEMVQLLLLHAANPSSFEALNYPTAASGRESVKLFLEKNCSALESAVEQGHTEIVQILLDNGAPVVNIPTGRSALTTAARRGREEIVRLLLQHGADANHQYVGRGGEPPLVAAASGKGRTGIVRMLLDHGADIDSFQIKGAKAYLSRATEAETTALQAASYHGDLELVGFLLDNGAKPNLVPGHRQSALFQATHQGHGEIVDLLLSRGAIIQRSSIIEAIQRGHTHIALSLVSTRAGCLLDSPTLGDAPERAYRSGFKEIEQELIQRDASVSLQHDRVAQEIWCGGNQEAIVKLLIRNGADLNAYGKALKAAHSDGDGRIVRLLLDNLAGFNCDFQGTDDATLLQAAILEQNEEVLRLLIDNGADIHHHQHEAFRFGNPLHETAHSGSCEILQILLQNGADINSCGDRYGSALALASFMGHDHVVQMLIAAGADVNANGDAFTTALQYASFLGYLLIVRQLLDAGANINADTGQIGTALHAAIREGHYRVVAALLRANANVNGGRILGLETAPRFLFRCSWYGRSPSALYAASKHGEIDLVKQLIRRGAEVDAYDEYAGSPLIIASFQGHSEIVQLLLDVRADPTLTSKTYGNALQAASERGHEAVVKMLLGKGGLVDGGEALKDALSNGHIPVADLLRQAGVEIETSEESSWTDSSSSDT